MKQALAALALAILCAAAAIPAQEQSSSREAARRIPRSLAKAEYAWLQQRIALPAHRIPSTGLCRRCLLAVDGSADGQSRGLLCG